MKNDSNNSRIMILKKHCINREKGGENISIIYFRSHSIKLYLIATHIIAKESQS